MTGAPQMQNPYGNNNMLLSNTPYDNYMGNRKIDSQELMYQFLKCRPVSSKEQAMAYQIDLDGSLWVFTDVGNGKIYTKQVNNDGTAAFKTYIFTEEQGPYNSNDYVTKSEFNKVVQTLMAAIQQQQQQNKQEVIMPAQNQNEKSLMNF